jgi:hypothetical protein
MSNSQHTNNRCRSMVHRLMSNPRMQSTLERPKKVFANALDKFEYANAVTKVNARDTFKEMGKLFSATEARSAFIYTKRLAFETHEEMVKPKFSIAKGAFRAILGTKFKAIKAHDLEIALDQSSDDGEEDQ